MDAFCMTLISADWVAMEREPSRKVSAAGVRLHAPRYRDLVW
jgi:hypothetical protein